MDKVWEALCELRVPLQQGEYDLHRMVMDCLEAHGLPYEHEKRLAPRCRIDLLSAGVGIEIKRGKPEKARLLEQLKRYAACEAVQALIVVCERHVDVPRAIGRKPVRLLCLNRLWGIAL
ncbi:MAG: hypothetical protein IKP40_00925 [Clostridia bacterium]|nr:hypothetical protein [Clostridia bacterium]